MAQDGSGNPVTGLTTAERIDATRAVVYEDGELIAPEALEDALRERGVSASKDEAGDPVYEDVPASLSLSACHLAVDTRRDPAVFLE